MIVSLLPIQIAQPLMASMVEISSSTILSGTTQNATIYRFPSNLLRIGEERDYIAPRTVAIGPYYHETTKLKEMEALKEHIVLQYFFGGNTNEKEATYKEFQTIGHSVRECYADTRAVRDIPSDKFVSMMFIDGCFSVQFICTISGRCEEAFLRRILHPHVNGILRDMMLLENQIPWAVMEFLLTKVTRTRLTTEDIIKSLVLILHGTLPVKPLGVDEVLNNCKPSHLLCLIRCFEAAIKRPIRKNGLFEKEISVYTSAGQLSEIGIKLEASETKQFSAMKIEKGCFTAKLYLAPLNLNSTVSCWLVNMAAFEMYTETHWEDDCAINSYLSVLSLLMNQKEDVRQLRAKRIMHGNSSDQATLEFFKGLGSNLSEGQSYVQFISDLEEYKQKRRLWIAIYKFVYINAKTIAAVLSIVSVLAGIFKTLYSLKQNQK